MATTPAETVTVGSDCVRVTWANMQNGDVGAPVDLAAYADRTIQVSGTFGSGGTAVIQGSVEQSNPNYQTLNDMEGNALSLTAAALRSVMELTDKLRPNVTAGDGTTSLTVSLLARKTAR